MAMPITLISRKQNLLDFVFVDNVSDLTQICFPQNPVGVNPINSFRFVTRFSVTIDVTRFFFVFLAGFRIELHLRVVDGEPLKGRVRKICPIRGKNKEGNKTWILLFDFEIYFLLSEQDQHV